MCPKKEDNATVSLARPSGEGVAANKRLKIDGQEMDALIDTGSDINIISTDAVRMLKTNQVHPCGMKVNGVGAKNVQCEGIFDAEIEKDGHSFRTRVYVVDREVILTKLIMGNELLSHADLVINGDGIQINRRKDGRKQRQAVLDEDGRLLVESGPVYEARSETIAINLEKRIVELEEQVERLRRCNKSLRTGLDQSKREKKELKSRLDIHEPTASARNVEMAKKVCTLRTTTEFVDREMKSRLKATIVRRGDDQAERINSILFSILDSAPREAPDHLRENASWWHGTKIKRPDENVQRKPTYREPIERS